MTVYLNAKLRPSLRAIYPPASRDAGINPEPRLGLANDIREAMYKTTANTTRPGYTEDNTARATALQGYARSRPDARILVATVETVTEQEQECFPCLANCLANIHNNIIVIR